MTQCTTAPRSDNNDDVSQNIDDAQWHHHISHITVTMMWKLCASQYHTISWPWSLLAAPVQETRVCVMSWLD